MMLPTNPAVNPATLLAASQEIQQASGAPPDDAQGGAQHDPRRLALGGHQLAR